MSELRESAPATDPNAPYLSFVVFSRNDDYGGNIIEKLRLSLQVLCAQLAEAPFSVEILVVDWNPPADRPLLAETLDLGEIPASVQVRFIVVPPEVHARYRDAHQVVLNSPAAQNVGIRRARGRFLLPRVSDVFYSCGLVEWLCRAELQEGRVYRCKRADVPLSELPDSDADWREMVTRLEQTEPAYVGDPLPLPIYPARASAFENASGDFLLAARSDWLRIRGFAERETAVSLDHDGLALHALIGAGCEQVVLPDSCRVLKIAHTQQTRSKVVMRPLPDWVPSLNERMVNRVSSHRRRQHGTVASWIPEAVQFWVSLLLGLPERDVRNAGAVSHPSYAEYQFQAALIHAARTGEGGERMSQWRRAWLLLGLAWAALPFMGDIARDRGVRATVRRLRRLWRLYRRRPAYLMNTSQWGCGGEQFRELQPGQRASSALRGAV